MSAPFAVSGTAVSFQVKNGLAPGALDDEGRSKGPRALVRTLAFSATVTQLVLDFQRIEDSQRLEFVQAIFIDNSQNPSPIQVTSPLTFQTKTIKAGGQGYLPTLSAAPGFQFNSLGGQVANAPVNVNIHFLNFMVPLAVWDTSGGLVHDFSANKPALLANAIATMPVNPSRNYLYAQNQSGETVQLVLDDAAGNNQSVILLAPGVGAGNQGADYTEYGFKGRARIMATTGNDQVCLREN